MWDDCPELIAALKSALIGQRYSPVVVRNRANLETKRKALEKGRRSNHTRRPAILEARCERARLARHALK